MLGHSHHDGDRQRASLARTSSAARWRTTKRNGRDSLPRLRLSALRIGVGNGALRRLDERGALGIDDAALAAEHFAFLVMGAQLDQALFATG